MQKGRLTIALATAALCVAVVAGAEDEDPREPGGPAEVVIPTGPGTARLDEVVVEAKKPVSAASSDEIRARDYELRPHATPQEILNNLPGVVVAQHQGGGKAAQYLVRGFDADHGTDFAVSVDELPVNLVTHAHGQGYADLNFLIPETVERLQLYKGPYFVQLGDLANAGALNFVTRDEFRENFALAEGGSFDAQRYVVGLSPRLGAVKTLLAGQAYYANGPFEHPQHFNRYNFYSKFTFEPTPVSKATLSGTLYQGSWRGSGQIPLREVSAGRLDRFGAIDPTEGGRTDRENLDFHYRNKPTAADEWTAQLYGSRYKLRLFSDFTFFASTGLRFFRGANGSIIDRCTSSVLPDCEDDPPPQNYIPGDGIEQNDQRYLYGGRGRYTHFWTVAGLPVQSLLGVETRNDHVNVALYRQVARHRFFTRNKVTVDEHSVSGFLQHQVFFTDWIRLEAGLRGDVFFFNGYDHLPAQPSDPNFTPVPVRGHTSDGIVSPKANLVLTPVENTDVFLNFGTGFHSNDARQALLALQHPEQAGGSGAPLARSLGYEVGSRTRQWDRLDAAAALWLLDLDSELVFSGDAGNQESDSGGSFTNSGKSRRWGVDFETRYQMTRWLFADYDLSWADPRFQNGDAIALAPTLLMNGGLTAELGNGFSAAFRVRFLDDRPAIEDRSLTARGYVLLDLLAKYRWRNLEAGLALLNLADRDWREAQFADNSCVRSELGRRVGCVDQPGRGGGPQPAPGIHFTPGNPFSVRAGMQVFF